MRQAAKIFAGIALIGSAGLSLAGGWTAVTAFEQMTKTALDAQRDTQADAWAEIEIDGLKVRLSGAAPSETDRFQFLRRVTAVIPSRRLNDQTTVDDQTGAVEPDYSLQVLRNLSDVSLIGLIPIDPDLPPIAERVSRIAPNAQMTNMLERVERAPPDTWGPALEFALSALEDLEQAKLSVRPGEVIVAGAVADQETLRTVEARLQTRIPDGISLQMDLTAPRPVISPFRFGARRADGGDVMVETCTVETQADAEALARTFNATFECAVGLGAPSMDWIATVGSAMEALSRLDDGEVDITDTRVHLIAGVAQDRDAFGDIADDLMAKLTPPFGLSRELPPLPPALDDTGAPVPPRFVAMRGTAGTVVLELSLIHI